MANSVVTYLLSHGMYFIFQFDKSAVMRFFDRSSSFDEIPPFVQFEMHKEDPSPTSAMFNIKLNGSTTDAQIPISFNIVCELLVDRPFPVGPNEIGIIREMYEANSPILDGLSGGSAEYNLGLDKYDSRILFCEISFHIPNWVKLAYNLNMDDSHIEYMHQRYINDLFPYEGAYKMLMEWLRRSNPYPKLSRLLDALKRVGVHLCVSNWKTQYDISHFTGTNLGDKFKDLSSKIKNQWKCVAHLLRIEEEEVIGIEHDYERETVRERAYQMLLLWRMSSELQDDNGMIVQLFNGLHCMNEHTGYFGDVLSSMI